MSFGSEPPQKVYYQPKKISSTSSIFDFSEVDNNLGRLYAQGTEIIPVRVVATGGTSANQTIITDGTDTLLVASDGSIGLTRKPLTMIRGFQAGAGTTTLGTVPANREWRVRSFNVSGFTTGAAVGTLSIGGQQFIVRVNAAVGYIDKSNNFGIDYIVATATQTITIASSLAAGQFDAEVTYEEVVV